ncbi:MAG: tail fiber domain-containing protein, partial [Bacteroidota bacterium]
FKKEIRALSGASEKLGQLTGASYAFKQEQFEKRNLPEGRKIGLIAQEVQKVFPELVAQDGEGYLSVNYDGLIPVLIEALKEQKQRIDQLEDKLSQQEVENQTETFEHPAQLYQNQPNPFAKSTIIPFYLPEGISQAQLLISDLQGRAIKHLPITQRGKGQIELTVQGWEKGIYLYTLILDGTLGQSKRMLVE